MINKPIVIKSSNLIKILTFNKAIGIVLYPFIIVKKDAKPSLINHEMIHFHQVKDYGMIRFYYNYLKEYFKLKKYYGSIGFDKIEVNRFAYRNISFEREAYENQSNLSYLVSRSEFNDKKYKIF